MIISALKLIPHWSPMTRFSLCLRTLALSALIACSLHLSAQSTTHPLPEAPSAHLPAPQSASLVNGRTYHRPTRREDFRAYRHEVIGPRPFIFAAAIAGIEQGRDIPIGWGQNFTGYAQRYGSAYAESAIDSSTRYGLAAALHEDVRYLVCHKCSASDKFENAFLAEFTARHGEEGRRSFSLTPVIAGFSGPLIVYSAWYPPGYDIRDAAKHASLGFTFRIFSHVVREFFFDKNTKAAAMMLP